MNRQDEKIYLKNFKLAGYYPYNPLKGSSMELQKELKGCTPWIDAKVPGSIYADLMKAGLIKNPYEDMNSLLCEWVSARWWTYLCEFDKPDFDGKRINLTFEGIDYKAHVFINAQKICTHEGCFDPLTIDVTNYLFDKKNLLKIVIESAPNEMGQVGYTCETFTQKPRFTYKWDFCVRMIGMGLFRPVYFSPVEKVVCDAVNVYSTTINELRVKLITNAEENLNYKLNYNLSFEGAFVSSITKSINGSYCGEEVFEINNPKVWNLNGYGKQNLYDLCITAEVDKQNFIIKKCKVGIKTIEWLKNENSPKNSPPYLISINGKSVFLKGVNVVPLDMMYGCVTEDDYKSFIQKCVELNINMIRVWGGGVIESELFYNLCDQFGIMVWQDFIQSSSGIDNYPSHKPEMLNLIQKTVLHAVKTLPVHPSLIIFCGGNELMTADYIGVTDKVYNISMIKHIVEEYCPNVRFLSSTPFGPTFCADMMDKNKNYDVHGQWTYMGIEKHYEYYNNMKCLIHSEFGVDGITNYSAIERSISPEYRYVCDYDQDMFWRHRGEWWNTFHRDREIFGDFKDLQTQSICSQFIQAEGIRYAVDAHRRQMPETSGCFVWQMNEPFPNGSCTSLIDYYGTPKQAYYALKNSYASIAGSFMYNKLIYEEGETIAMKFFITADFPFEGKATYWAECDGKMINKFENSVKFVRKAICVDEKEFIVPKDVDYIDFYISITNDNNVYLNKCRLLVKHNGYCKKMNDAFYIN